VPSTKGKVGGKSKADSLSKFKTYLDPDYKFSANRCLEAIPLGRDAYFTKLPLSYTSTFHKDRISQCKAAFDSIAIGPAYDFYWAKLKQECEEYWLNGRRLCDAVSLTGRHCVYQIHKMPAENGMDMPQDTIGADKSNSPVTPEVIKEPTTPSVSTEDELALKPKVKIVSLSSLESLPIKAHSSGYRSIHACNCGKSRKIREDPFDLKDANYSFFQFDCCSNLISLSFPSRGILDKNVDITDHVKEQLFTQSLPSWSLTRLGSGKGGYNPDRGLIQDGFLPGYNFMLPWDIPVPKTSLNSLSDFEKGDKLVNEELEARSKGKNKDIRPTGKKRSFSSSDKKKKRRI